MRKTTSGSDRIPVASREGADIVHGDADLAILFLVMAYFMFWFAILLPARMAAARGRSGLLWVLISLAGSPLLAILLLIALGDAGGRGR